MGEGIVNKETFGATAAEKAEIAWYLGLAIVFSGLTAYMTWLALTVNGLFGILPIISAGIVGISIYGIFNLIELVAIRIRLEESQHLTDVIDKIMSVYKETK